MIVELKQSANYSQQAKANKPKDVFQ